CSRREATQKRCSKYLSETLDGENGNRRLIDDLLCMRPDVELLIRHVKRWSNYHDVELLMVEQAEHLIGYGISRRLRNRSLQGSFIKSFLQLIHQVRSELSVILIVS